MTLLAIVFAAIAIAAAFKGLFGITLIGSGCVALMLVAKVVFTKQEQAWKNDPRNARVVPTTEAMMDTQSCECTRSHF